MTKLEMKRLLSAKLRDPATSTKDFVAMLPKLSKLSPEWHRKPRRVKQQDVDVDHLVLALERQHKLNRA
jgi:hypothetical protein